MHVFVIIFRANENLFLLIGFIFLFQGKIFAQSKQTVIDKPENFYDLCEVSKKGADAAKRLSDDSVFTSARIAIQKARLYKHERSITFGRNATGVVTISPMIDGDTSKGRVSSIWSGAFADIHNHTNDLPPSAGDLYYLVKLNSRNPLYDTRFVITASGIVYALFVYDLNLAKSFVSRYPSEQTPGFSPRFPEPIFDDVDRISIYFQGQGSSRLVAQERALAFVLAKYNSGAVLLKRDDEGNFKTLQTEEMTSNGSKIYVANDCK